MYLTLSLTLPSTHTHFRVIKSWRKSRQTCNAPPCAIKGEKWTRDSSCPQGSLICRVGPPSYRFTPVEMQMTDRPHFKRRWCFDLSCAPPLTCAISHVTCKLLEEPRAAGVWVCGVETLEGQCSGKVQHHDSVTIKMVFPFQYNLVFQLRQQHT